MTPDEMYAWHMLLTGCGEIKSGLPLLEPGAKLGRAEQRFIQNVLRLVPDIDAVIEGAPRIFVFGSNLAGRHGKGAALEARQKWGAEPGIGIGRTGWAYAIPTKDAELKTLPLMAIDAHVAGFLAYAQSHPELRFRVTRVGCGLAGYKESDIRPMFKRAPANCFFEWEEP